MTKLNQIFLDRRVAQSDTVIKRRWSDFPANRKAAMEGLPIPLNRKPRYKVEDIEFITREEFKEIKK